VRYWFDTEFIEDGKTIDLLSIGIVSEDERELYLEISETDWSKASQWVKDNVLVNLGRGPTVGKEEARLRVLDFIRGDKPEFWAYYADYDWVALCQLFGTMMDLPKGFPMYCRDIKQWCDQLGNPKLPKQNKGEHHALADAKWNKKAWVFLANYEGNLK